ncbi:hypothetical protein IF2G_09757 [Cordyceps javanica]|nr:hypothetical protein IF2G_09757 [Cordyceps javanica]
MVPVMGLALHISRPGAWGLRRRWGRSRSRTRRQNLYCTENVIRETRGKVIVGRYYPAIAPN